MPIREEPSQDPGNELFGYFDNLLDINLSGLVDGAYIRYDALSLSWLPVTGILPAPSTLDTLTDVVVGTPAVHQLIAYNGSNWINSGYLLNSLFDVDTTSASASGRALIWNGSFWIAGHPTGAGVGGVATLDDLTDTVISTAATHQILSYNGSNWINSGYLLNSLADVDTTSASASGRALIWNGSNWIAGHPTGAGAGGVTTLAALTDVALTSTAHGQGLVYDAATAKFINAYSVFSPTGLVVGGANNSNILNNALNNHGYVFLPSGNYYLTSMINITRNNAKLFGPGKLVADPGFTNSQIIYIGATGCTIEDVTVDGRQITLDGIIGINMGGPNGTLRNVVISGTPGHGINMPGTNTRVEYSRLYQCARSGGDAIDAVGLTNYISHTYIEGYGTKGIAGDCPLRNYTQPAYLFIDNCFIVAVSGNTTTQVRGECIIVDAGPGTSGYNAVHITNTNCEYRDLVPGISTQVVKLAIADNVHISNSNFYSRVTGADLTCGVRIAERVGSVHIEDSQINPNILYEVNTAGNRTTESIVIEHSKIGNWMTPLHKGYNAIEDLRSKYTRIQNCEISNSGTTTLLGVDWDLFERLEVSDNNFVANHSADVAALRWTTGTQEFSSHRIGWYNNRISNSGTASIFTASSYPQQLLQTAQDANSSVFTANAGSDVTAVSQISKITFYKNDRIINTGDMVANSVSEWICVASGKPGTWLPLTHVGNNVDRSVVGPTGLSTDISANNAPVITNFLNTYGYCYIPSGLYHISTHITMGANNLRLFGHGTLMGKSGFVNDQMIHMAATGCTVEDILLNGIHCPGNAGGINMGGRNNTIRNVTISNTKYHGVLMPGVNSRVDHCRIYTCGLSGAVGIKANGRINYVSNTLIDGWYGKGLVADHQKSLGEYSALFVDNCYLRTNTGVLTPSGIESCFLVDVGEGNPSYSLVALTNSVFEFEQVSFDGPSAEFNTNVLKLATTDNVKIDNCSIVALVTGINLIDGLHIAEKVANITIENSIISPNIGYEDVTTRVSDSLVVRNTQIGGIYPLHKNYRPLYQLRARHIHIDNCYLASSGTNIAIYTDHDDIQMLRVENCRIHGNYDSNFIGLTWNTGTQEYNSRRMVFKNNLITNSGAGAIFTAGNAALRLLYNTVDDDGSVWRTSCPSDPNDLNTIEKISFIKGDRIINSGAAAPGEVLEWVCISGGRPAKWEVAGRIESRITGYYDVTMFGVNNTGANVTTNLRTFMNNVPNNSTVRFPPGLYYVTGTIKLNQKVNVTIDCQGAEFREMLCPIVSGSPTSMGSGIFYLNYCTGVTMIGGNISGTATMAELMALSSGLVCSGYSSSAFTQWGNDGFENRNVIPTTFNLEQCSNITIRGWNVRAKYRFGILYRGLDVNLFDNKFIGIITGNLHRDQDIYLTGPTGNQVDLGQIHKVLARHAYCLTIVKGRSTAINRFDAYGCGGLLTVGSSSWGGGQGPSIAEQITVEHCRIHNAYDNYLYFSSAHKCIASHCIGWNDEEYSHIPGGMKGRGSNIVFDSCQVYHAHHGFGLEGISNGEDYWTNFGTPGWSSEGSKIINCTASDIGTYGIFLDPNDDNTVFPRDILIANNYLYNTQRGPYGRSPTGWISGDGYENAAITAPDAYRVKIINNTIESTGSIGPNQAIYVGRQRSTMWVTGVEIIGNRFLGCKQGIRAAYLSDFRIADNYAERMGYYGAPYIEQSGTSAFLVTENVRNGRIYDNMLAPTGMVPMLWTFPGSTFDNIRRRDNDGVEIIN